MRLICALLVLSLGTGVSANFNNDDLKELRRFADKFSVSVEQKETFLTKSRALVGSLSLATADQQKELIEILEDARYGGRMDDIITIDGGDGLESLITSARASSAGAVSSSSSGSSGGSTVTPSAAGGATFIERIGKLSNDLGQFKFKQSSEVERDSFYKVMEQIVADRGDSFEDERIRLKRLLSNSRHIIFRSDQERQGKVEQELIPKLDDVPFAMRLDRLELLYDRFSALNAQESERVLRHLKELVESVETASAQDQQDLINLLEFVRVTFFDSDPSAKSKIDAHLKSLASVDPNASLPYLERVSKLIDQARITPPSDTSSFMDIVQDLVEKRYGDTEDEEDQKQESQAKLQELLQLLTELPNFSGQNSQASVLLALVATDSVETTKNYEDRIEDHEEQVLSTRDDAERAKFMTSLNTLVAERYGSTQADSVGNQKEKNKARLLRLLKWVRGISWFSAEVSALDAHIATVESGSVGSSSSVVAGEISYLFDSSIDEQLAKLEGAADNVVSQDNKILFMLSLYNVMQRKGIAKTTEHDRMRALASKGKTSQKFGSDFTNEFDFLLAYMNDDVSNSDSYDFLLVQLKRIADAGVLSAQTQQRFIAIARSLVSQKNLLDSGHVNKLDDALKQADWRGNFRPEYAKAAREITQELGVVSSSSSDDGSTGDDATSDSESSSDTGEEQEEVSAQEQQAQEEAAQLAAQERARNYLRARRRRARR